MNFLQIGNFQNLPNVDAAAGQLIEFLQLRNARVKFFCNAKERVFWLDGITSSQRTRETECQHQGEKSEFHSHHVTRSFSLKK